MIDLSPLPPLPQPTMHLANAPQLNPVSWAFIIGREESVSPTELLVLVAAAQYAECASWSGEGAGAIPVHVLEQLTGLSPFDVDGAVRRLLWAALLDDPPAGNAGSVALPSHVWNGEWAR